MMVLPNSTDACARECASKGLAFSDDEHVQQTLCAGEDVRAGAVVPFE